MNAIFNTAGGRRLTLMQEGSVLVLVASVPGVGGLGGAGGPVVALMLSPDEGERLAEMLAAAASMASEHLAAESDRQRLIAAASGVRRWL